MSLNIYVLRLEGGKYYIGKTTDVIQRYQEHLAGQGAAFTKRHPPVALEATFPETSPFDEDKTTKEYMLKYGVDNVRGGAYVLDTLTKGQVEALKLEFRAAKDRCIKCGGTGHYADKCTFVISQTRFPLRCSLPDEPYIPPKQKQIKCYRCGRKGHISTECFAKTHVRGYDIVSKKIEPPTKPE